MSLENTASSGVARVEGTWEGMVGTWVAMLNGRNLAAMFRSLNHASIMKALEVNSGMMGSGLFFTNHSHYIQLL